MRDIGFEELCVGRRQRRAFYNEKGPAVFPKFTLVALSVLPRRLAFASHEKNWRQFLLPLFSLTAEAATNGNFSWPAQAETRSAQNRWLSSPLA
jgi:hypothetical protein